MAPPLALLLLLAAATRVPAAAQQPPPLPMARLGCRDKCGNISIPYPFGIGPGCFIANQFQVFCNDSASPPRAFLVNTSGTYQQNSESSLVPGGVTKYPLVIDWSANPREPIELMDISLARGEVRAYGAVSSYCTKSSTSQVIKLQLTVVSPSKTGNWPFTTSMERNALVGIGVSVEARLATHMYMDWPSSDSWLYTTCTSDASDNFRKPINGSCTGNGCCQVPFAGNSIFQVPLFAVSFKPENQTRWDSDKLPCLYGMVVENGFYNFSSLDLSGYEVLSKKFPRGVPFVIDFAIIADDGYTGNGSCPVEGRKAPPGYACASRNSFCANNTYDSERYLCHCKEYYEGNPYVTNGCQDIDECKNPDLYPCHGNCKNRLGGYDCPCKRGMKGDGKAGTCKEIFPLVAQVIVGAGCAIGFVVVIFLIILLKERRKTRNFYKKNGGPILEKAKLIKLYRKKDLNQVLLDSNIIGQGFFGEVYKGFLGNEQVAIKKLKISGVLENEQFANEVIIQSQVTHKNIVRLIGCCLEVDTPILVYEFIPKGSLHDILHDHNNNNKVALSLDLRISIAAQSADGLAYIHSKTNNEILHGDVKPANILLDDNFSPKIADFGLSRLLARDTKHTELVIGDIKYMDPTYQKEGLLTGKSDVYSFGVVLLELISRRKVVRSDTNNLLNSFLEAHERDMMGIELFDEEIAVPKDLGVLNSLIELAMECLSLQVDERPTMTEVAARLFLMGRSHQQ
ncbi:wall-associated receptor kinase 2-like [Lolium perenne]|uniref:wall-associated receptor kinase 2-like n=1 Tax=Lolium perenne TaxID=4522 RepID=UPI0021F5AD5B|nr:wall-associated receptor kinase-like 8 [Lolium perenne]